MIKMACTLDKNAFSIGSLHGESDEKSFWKSQSPAQRLEALELMRQINYGYASTTARLQRFFEITKLK
ncbi:MAG: hypothetical protein DRP83_07810 [Planctomycetota bacterium]|nr:MAG: hypothetical protein DRP83_07810 [Planctomycetota bacterium]